MNSSSLTTNTLGKWGLLFAALLIVPQFALANKQIQIPTKTLPTPPAKNAPEKNASAKSSSAPVEPQTKLPAQKPPKTKEPKVTHKPGDPTGPNPSNQGLVIAKRGPNGSNIYTKPNGAEYIVNRDGKLTNVKTSSGNYATFTGNLKVASIHTTDGLTINRAGNGARSAETTRKDGTRVVSFGSNRGFTERTVTRNGQTETVRTSVVHRKTSTSVYQRLSYRRVSFDAIVPVNFYAPPFYVWAGAPWDEPVYWGWGWDSQPWYSDCGYYFAASPNYAGPAFWLTDYMLAEDLRAAHESAQQTQTDSNTDQGTSDDRSIDDSSPVPPLSPDVKKEIAEQVNEQIDAEEASASAGSASVGDQLPAALDPNQRVFIVSRALAEQTDDGGQCSLSPGDILTRTSDSLDANQKVTAKVPNVTVTVIRSQRNDCAAKSEIAVSIRDLQDMHNDFVQTIDAGLLQLAANKGTKGMPKGPEAGAKTNPAAQADSDPNALASVQQQEQAADAAEQDVNDTMDPGQ